MHVVSLTSISAEEVEALNSMDFDSMNMDQRKEVLNALQDIAGILSLPPDRHKRTSVKDGFKSPRLKLFMGKSEAN